MSHTHKRFALRVDISDESKQKLIEWINKFDGYILVREVAPSGAHCHAILDAHKDLKSVRNSFMRAFPELVGNKAYSLKECNDDYEAYIRYICKGDGKDQAPVVWGRCGLLYTDILIAEAHDKYYVNQEAVIENAVKRKKIDKLNLVEELEKVCKLKNYTSRKEISWEYIRRYRDARKGINIFAARAVVNTVWVLLGGESAEEELAHKISEL